MPKTLLYIDVDDTILAQCFSGAAFDLRPGVLTQIRVLSKLFDCWWLTHWSKDDLAKLLNSLYSGRLINSVSYADWRKVNTSSKAPFVMSGPTDFYWVEDTLSTGSMKDFLNSELKDRYIPVKPKGLWEFTRALQVLFSRSGVKTKDIIDAGGQPEWFNEPLGLHFDWTYYEQESL